MVKNSPEISLRVAGADEIDLLVSLDDDAVTLFKESGFDLSGGAIDAFAQAERSRWLQSAERGLAELALDKRGVPVGFVALGLVDGRPYLDQLSVVRSWMRRGVGRALLARAIAWSEWVGELWLTTYAHLPWNGPMYERAGFTRVDEALCGPELREILREQRAALPEPKQRCAMVRRNR